MRCRTEPLGLPGRVLFNFRSQDEALIACIWRHMKSAVGQSSRDEYTGTYGHIGPIHHLNGNVASGAFKRFWKCADVGVSRFWYFVIYNSFGRFTPLLAPRECPHGTLRRHKSIGLKIGRNTERKKILRIEKAKGKVPPAWTTNDQPCLHDSAATRTTSDRKSLLEDRPCKPRITHELTPIIKLRLNPPVK